MDTCQDELGRQIRDALAHLYDYVYLQRHPLAERLLPAHASTIRTRAQELRRILLDAIESLNPGDSVPIRALERRPYAILFGLYVEGRPLLEVADRLSIGGRQLRRDRAAAFTALASLLRDRYPLVASGNAGASGAQEPLRLESERMAQCRELIDLADLVDGLLPLLQSLAREHRVHLLSHVALGLPQPYRNRTLLRQILIGLASQALTTMPISQLAFEARLAGALVGIGLGLRYRQESSAAMVSAAGPQLEVRSLVTLIATLGGSLLQEVPRAGEETAWVLLPLQDEMVVLVVDDNQELFALFERYLAGQPYRPLHAASSDQALALAHSRNPGVITLDLMLPGRDGWDLLQALRSDPATSRIPVIVCSVLEEPELAQSLGAQQYLKKPVGQAALLSALEAAKTQAWAGEGRPAAPGHSPALPSR